MAQLVQSKDIYHGLPVFPPETKGLTAIITGANGISGRYTLRVLAESPERWSKIYCLSRSPPTEVDFFPSNAEHISVDFTQDPQELARVLKGRGVEADYIFWYSYVHLQIKEGDFFWCDSADLCAINKRILHNFLEALSIASVIPKRFLLQTGAKNYGLQCGPVKQPCEEWDPRYTKEPNFYYEQEDMLLEFCTRNNVGWNVTCPAGSSLPKLTLLSLLSDGFPVFAAAPTLAMNPGFALAAYATICGHLKQPLCFPGGVEAWQSHFSHITGKLNGYFAEWAVLTEEAKNQKFNIHDNSFFTCESLWPKLAGWYGIGWTGPEETGLTEVKFGHSPPPRGHGPRALIRYKFTFEDWAASPEVKQAWTELAEKHGLVCKDLNQLTQALKFGNATVQQPGTVILSMDKARKLGWHGYVDTYQGLLEVFDEFAELRMIPKAPKIRVGFL